MSQYYFFVASLPTLSLTGDRRPTLTAFLAGCREHLSDHDLRTVESLDLSAPHNAPSTPALVRDWRAFEMGVRNELARQRGAELGIDAAEYLRRDAGRTYTDLFGVADVVRDVRSIDSPLAAEEALDRVRWSRLDELETGHYFDTERVLVYYLKLQLLERRSAFDRTAGEERFAGLTEQIVNDYYQEQSAI